MTYRLTRRYTIAAAHHLFGLGKNHKCGRPHGHGYVIDLTLSTSKLDNGMVVEMGHLDAMVKRIVMKLDHTDLNAFDDGGSEYGKTMAAQPTAENIAAYLWHACACLQNSGYGKLKVRVQECEELAVEVEA